MMKKKSFSGGKGGGRGGEGRGGLWGRFMTSKVSRKCSAGFWVSDPGVAGAEPGDAHDLTGREIMLVSALCASGGAGEIH